MEILKQRGLPRPRTGGMGAASAIIFHLLSMEISTLPACHKARQTMMTDYLSKTPLILQALRKGRKMKTVMTKASLRKLIVLTVMGVLMVAPSAAIAQGPGVPLTTDVTLEDMGYTIDDTVQGVLVTREYGLSWPNAWEPQAGNTLILHFSHSPALDPRSTMTVEFNGTQLSSVLLTPENTEYGTLQVALPENSIHVGYNGLRLNFYMGLYDFNCQDIDDPAVWTTVHKITTFHLSYTLTIPDPNLANFPLPFMDNSPLVENHVTFILPDQPTPAELSAAVTISAKLGQLAAWRTIHLHTLSEAQAQDPTAVMGDLILVGRADRLQTLQAMPLSFVSWQDGQPVLIDSAGAPLPSEAGVLWEQLSSVDATTVMLIVTGATDEAVLTAARALADEATYPRLVGQLGIVLNVPEPPPTDLAVGQVITLEDLGYEERTVWGSREQSIKYAVPLPFAWQIRFEGTFDLHFAHSAIVDSQESSLSVLLNDVPVGSILLTPENAEDALITFRLATRLFESGNNALSVLSDMDVDEGDEDHIYRYDYDCLEPEPKQTWLVVYADSQLNLPGEPTSLVLSLADYPRAFAGPADLSDLAFIVPDPTGGIITHATIQIAKSLGYFAEGEALAPQVISAQTLESMASPPEYQILIGRPTQNTAIARLNDDLPQSFKPGTDEPQPVETLAQIVPPGGIVGYVQAVLSSDGYPRLIVTGTTDEGVSWASDTLSDSDLMNELAGDLAIVSAAGAVVTAEDSTISAEDIIATAEVRPAEDRQPPPPQIVEEAVPAVSRRTDWIKWLAVGLFALTVFVLALAVWPEAQQRWKARTHHGT